MLLAIIADSHDNGVYTRRFLEWSRENNIKELICCGDVCNSETLKLIATEFKNKIYLVRGNSDIYHEEEVEFYKNIEYLGRDGDVIQLGALDIGICHEPDLIHDLIDKHKCHYVFYGHTHKPWQEQKIQQGNSVELVNPGTLGGVFNKATFATLDTNTRKLELKIVESLK